MFEKKHEGVIPAAMFARRMAVFVGLALLLIGLALCIGVLGYHYIAGFSFIDSILNASMILTGMGPVGALTSTAAKLFASGYALFSGLVFITVMGVVLTPLAHRLLHRFHVDETLDDARTEQPPAGDVPKAAREERTMGFTLIELMLTLVVLGVVAWLSVQGYRRWVHPDPSATSSATQLERLDSIQKSLQELSEFVDGQRQQLTQSQSTINGLHPEARRTLPLVEADGRVDETIYGIRKDGCQHNLWIERGLGFIMGVLATLMAIMMLGSRHRRRQKAPSTRDC